jgi:hypothetical protein
VTYVIGALLIAVVIQAAAIAVLLTLSSSGQLADVDTTVVAGLRFYVRF